MTRAASSSMWIVTSSMGGTVYAVTPDKKTATAVASVYPNAIFREVPLMTEIPPAHTVMLLVGTVSPLGEVRHVQRQFWEHVRPVMFPSEYIGLPPNVSEEPGGMQRGGMLVKVTGEGVDAVQAAYDEAIGRLVAQRRPGPVTYSGTVEHGWDTDVDRDGMSPTYVIGGQDFLVDLADRFPRAPVRVTLNGATYEGPMRIWTGHGGYSEYTPAEDDEFSVGGQDIWLLLLGLLGQQVTLTVELTEGLATSQMQGPA